MMAALEMLMEYVENIHVFGGIFFPFSFCNVKMYIFV